MDFEYDMATEHFSEGFPAADAARTTGFRYSEPYRLFQAWLREANLTYLKEPTTMTLATVDEEGNPHARVLLLKSLDDGFVFYTNMESPKAKQCRLQPRVALCFHWDPLSRQVRVEGNVTEVTKEEADAYFASRPRNSQIAAWVSRQSDHMENPDELVKRMERYRDRFTNKQVKRPNFWSGFRVIPQKLEFWESQPFRTHHRVEYKMENGGWEKQILFP